MKHLVSSLLRTKTKAKIALLKFSTIYNISQQIYRKLIYPFERKFLKAGRGFESVENLTMAGLLPIKTINYLIEHTAPKSWCDVGCGVGAALSFVEKRIEDVAGYEYSRVARENKVCNTIIQPIDLSIANKNERTFELVWCYEVAEHLDEIYANLVVKNLTNFSSKYILFSAAHPGQGGEGHINEREKEYWITKFRSNGWEVLDDHTENIFNLKELYFQNCMLLSQISDDTNER